MIKFLISIGLLIATLSANSNDYIITSFGVSNDSTKLSTAVIQNIIDMAFQKGGGTIVVPKGTFLSGALFFKPNTNLKLLEGAILKGSDNIADYPLIPSRMEGKNIDYYAALINAYRVNNFTISGSGTINGNGLKFWKGFWAYADSMKKMNRTAINLDVHRPRLIFIWGCNNVSIQNVKLCNSAYWTTHLYQCTNVKIENCEFRSPKRPIAAPSTDGIDLDVCKDIIIRNCYMAINDDAIAIKGGKGPNANNLPENGIVENVLIENCTFGESHSSLTLGSECIHARNIRMQHCKVDNNCPILKLKMRPDTYQTYEDIIINDITGYCNSIINMKPWEQYFDMEGSTEKPRGIVRNISITNIKVKCTQLGEMAGNTDDSVSNISFKDIDITATKVGFKNKFKDVTFENVLINGQPLY